MLLDLPVELLLLEKPLEIAGQRAGALLVDVSLPELALDCGLLAGAAGEHLTDTLLVDALIAKRLLELFLPLDGLGVAGFCASGEVVTELTQMIRERPALGLGELIDGLADVFQPAGGFVEIPFAQRFGQVVGLRRCFRPRRLHAAESPGDFIECSQVALRLLAQALRHGVKLGSGLVARLCQLGFGGGRIELGGESVKRVEILACPFVEGGVVPRRLNDRIDRFDERVPARHDVLVVFGRTGRPFCGPGHAWQISDPQPEHRHQYGVAGPDAAEADRRCRLHVDRVRRGLGIPADELRESVVADAMGSESLGGGETVLEMQGSVKPDRNGDRLRARDGGVYDADEDTRREQDAEGDDRDAKPGKPIDGQGGKTGTCGGCQAEAGSSERVVNETPAPRSVQDVLEAGHGVLPGKRSRCRRRNHTGQRVGHHRANPMVAATLGSAKKAETNAASRRLSGWTICPFLSVSSFFPHAA